MREVLGVGAADVAGAADAGGEVGGGGQKRKSAIASTTLSVISLRIHKFFTYWL